MTFPSTELTVGTELPPRRYGPLTRTDIIHYQGVSGDLNPIHHDDSYAQSAGFPTAFSVGMFQAGILASYLTDQLGPENVRRYAIQFREQLWPGDTITCTAVVTRAYSQDDHDHIDLDITATRDANNKPAIKGTATFIIP